MHDIVAKVRSQETLSADYRCLVIEAPAIARAQEVVPESKLVLQGLTRARDGLYLRAMDAAFAAATNAMLVPRLGWGDPLAARCASATSRRKGMLL